MRNCNTQSCCKMTMMGEAANEAIMVSGKSHLSLQAPANRTGSRQTWRGQRQSSHWLHRFKRQSRWNERCQDSSAKLDQSAEFWTVCEPLFGYLWEWFCCEKADVRLCCLFSPEPLGNFLGIWAWLIRRDVLLHNFTGVCFHLAEWITAACIWDYYYILCNWSNRLLIYSEFIWNVASWVGERVKVNGNRGKKMFSNLLYFFISYLFRVKKHILQFRLF